MADAINAALMKNRFYEQLEHYRRSRPPRVIVSISDKRYQEILEDIPKAKSCEHKSNHELWLLKTYDILEINGNIRLIDPRNKMIYLADGQLFDALHEVHISVGHVGRSRMSKVLRAQYKNITRNDIDLYYDLCQQCQHKPSKFKSKLQNITRGQTAIIDYHTNPDGEYNFLLIYQDYLTKFIILRPLKTNYPSEVAYNLLDIFSIFGAPSVLCYYNNIDYIKQIIEYFRSFQMFKIIHGDFNNIKDQEYMKNIIYDINSKIKNWMQQNTNSHWSIGSSVIQLMKNQEYNYDILQSPYKALFGDAIKLGLTIDNPNCVQSEEDLEKTLSGRDLIEVKYVKKPSAPVSNTVVPSSKKTKKRTKANPKEATATELLFDDNTCSYSMSETLAATKSIMEFLDDSEPVYDTTCAQEETTNAEFVSVICSVDAEHSSETIDTDLVRSQPLFEENIPTANLDSDQDMLYNTSTESYIRLPIDAATISATPIIQKFDQPTNILTILATNVNNVTSTEISNMVLLDAELICNLSSSNFF